MLYNFMEEEYYYNFGKLKSGKKYITRLFSCKRCRKRYRIDYLQEDFGKIEEMIADLISYKSLYLAFIMSRKLYYFDKSTQKALR